MAPKRSVAVVAERAAGKRSADFCYKKGLSFRLAYEYLAGLVLVQRVGQLSFTVLFRLKLYVLLRATFAKRLLLNQRYKPM